MVSASWWKSLFEFQLLGECHCWWTSESPRAHVAKFYGRLRLIRSVWRASKFSVFEFVWNCNFVGLLHHPFWLQLVLALFGHCFSTFVYTTCLAGDHWRGFSTRNVHVVHVVNLIRLKMVCASWWKSLFIFQLLGECHCWWTSESPRAHVAKFYGRLRLIRSVWRASKFSVFKIDWNCNFVGLLHHPFWL